MGFTTREMTVLALTSALLFAVDIVVTESLDLIFGIPEAGYLISSVLFVGIATTAGLLVRKPGAFTVMAIIYSILASPTTVFGPPGPYKILLGTLIGIFADFIVWLFRYSKTGYLAGMPTGSALSVPASFLMYILLDFPAADVIAPYVWAFTFAVFVTSVLGAWLGIMLYEKKLKRLRVVKLLSQ